MERKVGLVLAWALACTFCFRDVVGMQYQEVKKVEAYSPSYDSSLTGEKITENEFDSLCDDGRNSVNQPKGEGCPKFAAFTVYYTEPEEEKYNLNLLQCPSNTYPVYVLKSNDGSAIAFYEGTILILNQKRGGTDQGSGSGNKRTRGKNYFF